MPKIMNIEPEPPSSPPLDVAGSQALEPDGSSLDSKLPTLSMLDVLLAQIPDAATVPVIPTTPVPVIVPPLPTLPPTAAVAIPIPSVPAPPPAPTMRRAAVGPRIDDPPANPQPASSIFGAYTGSMLDNEKFAPPSEPAQNLPVSTPATPNQPLNLHPAGTVVARPTRLVDTPHGQTHQAIPLGPDEVGEPVPIEPRPAVFNPKVGLSPEDSLLYTLAEVVAVIAPGQLADRVKEHLHNYKRHLTERHDKHVASDKPDDRPDDNGMYDNDVHTDTPEKIDEQN